MKNKNVFVVIPANNEEKTIVQVIKGAKKFCKNIIVVDDGSKDNTYSVVEKLDVILLKHIINLGKGAALKTGCDYAMRQNAANIVVMDADLQHDPKEIPNFLEKLKTNDVVLGNRRINRKMPFVFKLGNQFINMWTSILYNINIRDTQCGYRAFTVEAYKKIRWKSNDYSMESEMIANLGKSHLRYDNVKIETIYSDRYKGTTVIDGIKIVFKMLFWKIIGW